MTLAEAREEAQLLEMCSSLEIDCNVFQASPHTDSLGGFRVWGILGPVRTLVPNKLKHLYPLFQFARVCLQILRAFIP